MNQPLTLTLTLICFVSVSAETLPRFLRGDKVRCLDRDSADNLGTFAGNVATDLLEANLIYWEGRSYKGDVVVAFINDVYWIDFDGKSDQPWHRSLNGNAHGGTDRCITEDHYQYLVDNPTNTGSNIEANIEGLKGGYGNAQRLTRLGSEYDISSCNPALSKAIYNDKLNKWATSLQECHETSVTQHQPASDFGSFEECYDECKDSRYSCKYCPNLNEGFRWTGDESCKGFRLCYYYSVAHGKSCRDSKCGTHGVCCRHGYESDEGYCMESVSVDTDIFKYNMNMGTYNHHGCVPKPRDPKTCKCSTLEGEDRITKMIAGNGLVKPCVTCNEGFTTYHSRGDADRCLETTKCERCQSSASYPDIAGGPCIPCATIEVRESPKCGMGRIYRGCNNMNRGSCRDCGVDQYTIPTTDPYRIYCYSCNGTTLPLGPNVNLNRFDECASYNATLEGCGPGPGICVCNPGHTPRSEGNVTADNPCIPCEVGTFKSTTKNEACEPCATRGQSMYSPQGSESVNQCSCFTKANEIPYFFAGIRECRQCRDFQGGHLKPYKAVDSIEDVCSSCPDGTWFDTDESPANCTTIPTMQLQCHLDTLPGTMTIDPPLDHYRSPLFNFKPVNGNEVPIDHYLSTVDYTIHSCKDECNDYQYSHLCGRPLNGEIYWKKMEDNVVSVMKTGNLCDSSTASKYEIKREGICKDCTDCTVTEFNSGCGSNSAGTCQPCKTSSSCQTSNTLPMSNSEYINMILEYKHHEKDTGCNDPTAISDYECKECKKVEKIGANSDFKYYIIESCGDNDYYRWDTDLTNGVQMLYCTRPPRGPLKPGCDFDDIVQGGIAISRIYFKGTHLPYCPPGYKVDEKCFQQNPDLWNKDCCAECSPDNPEKKKSAIYEICPGDSPIDTQIWVDRCENNYYTYKSGTEEVCKPCEMCA